MTASRCGLCCTTGAAWGSTTYEMCASGKRSRSARMAGVVNTTSPISRRRTSRMRNSFFDGCFVEEHDRNVVLDRVHTFARCTLQRCAVLHEHDRRFAVGTRKNLEQLRIDRHARTIEHLPSFVE